MNVSEQIAKHLREVYFGGNWSTSCLKEHLEGVTWEQATTQVHGFNAIATLVYHTGYYVSAVSKVLQGEPLNAKDELSFNHPPIHSEQDWQALLGTTWTDAENFAKLIEQLPESKLGEVFTDPKRGIYYRHLHGIIEHTHYHVGQIVLIKKLILAKS